MVTIKREEVLIPGRPILVHSFGFISDDDDLFSLDAAETMHGMG